MNTNDFNKIGQTREKPHFILMLIFCFLTNFKKLKLMLQIEKANAENKENQTQQNQVSWERDDECDVLFGFNFFTKINKNTLVYFVLLFII